MSGGFFNYNQYKIREMIEQLKDHLREDGDDYKLHVCRQLHHALIQMRIAYVFAQRVDWFLSGDDGEENFLKRLQEDLTDIFWESEVKCSYEEASLIANRFLHENSSCLLFWIRI